MAKGFIKDVNGAARERESDTKEGARGYWSVRVCAHRLSPPCRAESAVITDPPPSEGDLLRFKDLYLRILVHLVIYDSG